MKAAWYEKQGFEIGEIFELESIVEAHKVIEEGNVTGRVILKTNPNYL